MRKTVFILLFCFCSVYARAQSRWAISYSPASIIDPRLNLAIQPGIEYVFNRKFSLLTEFGLRKDVLEKDSSYLNSKYFRVKTELRYFRKDKSSRRYFALQLSYAARSFDDLAGGLIIKQKEFRDSAFRYDQARVHSPVLTASLQIGRMFDLSDKLSIDLGMGAGIRDIITSYSRVSNLQYSPYYRRDCIPFGSIPGDLYEGARIKFHFNISLRLLYRFAAH